MLQKLSVKIDALFECILKIFFSQSRAHVKYRNYAKYQKSEIVASLARRRPHSQLICPFFDAFRFRSKPFLAIVIFEKYQDRNKSAELTLLRSEVPNQPCPEQFRQILVTKNVKINTKRNFIQVLEMRIQS